MKDTEKNLRKQDTVDMGGVEGEERTIEEYFVIFDKLPKKPKLVKHNVKTFDEAKIIASRYLEDNPESILAIISHSTKIKTKLILKSVP